jgi:hypothetical protein
MIYEVAEPVRSVVVWSYVITRFIGADIQFPEFIDVPRSCSNFGLIVRYQFLITAL